MTRTVARTAVTFVALAFFAGCAGKKPPPGPTTGPSTPAAPTVTTPETPPPPTRAPEPPTVPTDPTAMKASDLNALTVDEINKNSPMKPVFFAFDADTIDEDGRKVLDANAQVLKQYPNWVITIEGHADERGTSEYNLALGDRRALAAKNYLVTLGVPADRLKTVSYGKEFPFDTGHDESAWAQNRRAHFTLTAK